jgi:hypothetical protein
MQPLGRAVSLSLMVDKTCSNKTHGSGVTVVAPGESPGLPTSISGHVGAASPIVCVTPPAFVVFVDHTAPVLSIAMPRGL